MTSPPSTLGRADETEPIRRALAERARALARPASAQAPRDTLELVTFALGNETYAIEARYVLQVFRLAGLSPLPGAEAPVFGVTAWRGGLLTIVDLRQALGVSIAALDDLSRVVVLGGHRPAFGILADAVHELVTVPGSAIRTPPDGVAVKREYLRGVTGQAVLVLDGQRLLRIAGPTPGPEPDGLDHHPGGGR